MEKNHHPEGYSATYMETYPQTLPNIPPYPHVATSAVHIHSHSQNNMVPTETAHNTDNSSLSGTIRKPYPLMQEALGISDSLIKFIHQLQSTSEMVEKTRTEIDSREQYCNTLHQDTQRLHMEALDIRRKAEETVQEHTKQKDQTETLINELQHCKTEMTQKLAVKEEILLTMKQQQETLNSTLKSTEAEVIANRSTIRQLQQERDDLQAKYQELQRIYDHEHVKNEEITTKLRTVTQNYEQTVDELKKEVYDLRSQVAKANAVEDKNNQLTNEVSILRKQLKDNDKYTKDLQEKFSIIRSTLLEFNNTGTNTNSTGTSGTIPATTVTTNHAIDHRSPSRSSTTGRISSSSVVPPTDPFANVIPTHTNIIGNDGTSGIISPIPHETSDGIGIVNTTTRNDNANIQPSVPLPSTATTGMVAAVPSHKRKRPSLSTENNNEDIPITTTTTTITTPLPETNDTKDVHHAAMDIVPSTPSTATHPLPSVVPPSDAPSTNTVTPTGHAWSEVTKKSKSSNVSDKETVKSTEDNVTKSFPGAKPFETSDILSAISPSSSITTPPVSLPRPHPLEGIRSSIPSHCKAFLLRVNTLPTHFTRSTSIVDNLLPYSIENTFIIPLKIGKNEIGRGSSTGMSDQKVSRKQIDILISEPTDPSLPPTHRDALPTSIYNIGMNPVWIGRGNRPWDPPRPLSKAAGPNETGDNAKTSISSTGGSSMPNATRLYHGDIIIFQVSNPTTETIKDPFVSTTGTPKTSYAEQEMNQEEKGTSLSVQTPPVSGTVKKSVSTDHDIITEHSHNERTQNEPPLFTAFKPRSGYAFIYLITNGLSALSGSSDGSSSASLMTSTATGIPRIVHHGSIGKSILDTIPPSTVNPPSFPPPSSTDTLLRNGKAGHETTVVGSVGKPFPCPPTSGEGLMPTGYGGNGRPTILTNSDDGGM